jgi:RNA polymerase sigma-70 factor (ECF subfamily)
VLVVPDATARVELDEVLAQLDDDRRAAFVLTQVLGLRYDEAADVLGCPVGTIRSRVARARGDLVEMIAPVTDDDSDASDESTSAGGDDRRRLA